MRYIFVLDLDFRDDFFLLLDFEMKWKNKNQIGNQNKIQMTMGAICSVVHIFRFGYMRTNGYIVKYMRGKTKMKTND